MKKFHSLYGLRKLGISCVGYGRSWKMTKKDQFENKKAINTLVIVWLVSPCNSLRVFAVLWEGTA